MLNETDLSRWIARRWPTRQVVVEYAAKAKKALNAAQIAFAEGTLEQVELPNKPGALANLRLSWPRRA